MLSSFKIKSPRGQEGRINIRPAIEAPLGKPSRPLTDRVDVDVRGLLEVARSGAEQDLVGGRGHRIDRQLHGLRIHVLQGFDARDHVVFLRVWLGGASYAQTPLDIIMGRLDGMGGDVDTFRVDPLGGKRLYEKTPGAADVQEALGLGHRHDPVGDPKEEVAPLVGLPGILHIATMGTDLQSTTVVVRAVIVIGAGADVTRLAFRTH